MQVVPVLDPMLVGGACENSVHSTAPEFGCPPPPGKCGTGFTAGAQVQPGGRASAAASSCLARPTCGVGCWHEVDLRSATSPMVQRGLVSAGCRWMEAGGAMAWHARASTRLGRGLSEAYLHQNLDSSPCNIPPNMALVTRLATNVTKGSCAVGRAMGHR
jgi:hypothetical protein